MTTQSETNSASKENVKFKVAFRREWDECFSIEVEAAHFDEAREKAIAEAEHTATDWSNMEEVCCEPIFVDGWDPEANAYDDEQWERPLSEEERLMQAAPHVISVVERAHRTLVALQSPQGRLESVNWADATAVADALAGILQRVRPESAEASG